MHLRAKILAGFASAALVTSSIFANEPNGVVIKGKVIGDDGKPADGAELRVKSLDRNASDKVVQTDSRGQYIVLGLVPGKYAITASDSDGFARSRAIIK